MGKANKRKTSKTTTGKLMRVVDRLLSGRKNLRKLPTGTYQVDLVKILRDGDKMQIQVKLKKENKL